MTCLKHPGSALRILLAAALAAAAIPSPARAQIESALELDGRKLMVTAQEMTALSELGLTLGGGNRARQDLALDRARSVVNGLDARYALARYELELGRQRGDDAMRAGALDVLIASDMTPADKLAGYLAVRGGIAARLGDFETARTLWTRLQKMKPDDPDVLANLAQLGGGEAGEAAGLLERAIAARKASGKPVPESLYRQWFSVAHEGRLVGPGLAAARALVAAYPTPRNWREALVAYRQLAAPEGELEIDHLRLMRAAGALAKGEEYQRMAQLLNRSGAPLEARSVLDEAVSRGLLDPARSPTREIAAEVGRAIARENARPRQSAVSAAGALALADWNLGAGRHSEAASLYRSALAGSAGDSARVNGRLGIALALAGRRPEAEAAFALAASDGSASARLTGYGELARFWLAWLAHPPAAPAAGRR